MIKKTSFEHEKITFIQKPKIYTGIGKYFLHILMHLKAHNLR